MSSPKDRIYYYGLLLQNLLAGTSKSTVPGIMIMCRKKPHQLKEFERREAALPSLHRTECVLRFSVC